MRQAFPMTWRSSVGPVLLPCRLRVGVSPHTPRRTDTPARRVACRVPVLRGRTSSFQRSQPAPQQSGPTADTADRSVLCSTCLVAEA